MIEKYFSFFILLSSGLLFSQEIQYKDEKITHIRISTSSEETESKSLVNVFSDHVFIQFDDKKNSYKIFNYSRNRVQYVNGKINPLQFAYAGDIVGNKVPKEKLVKVIEALRDTKDSLTISKNNLKKLVSKVTQNRIKSILSENRLYKKFRRELSSEEQKLFYKEILEDSLKRYLKGRFSASDTLITTFPKSFEISIYYTTFLEQLLGNTSNSVLHPWGYTQQEFKTKKTQTSQTRNVNYDPKLDSFINKYQKQKEEEIEYTLVYNLDLNLALAEIIPHNMWNKPFTTMDGIIKDYVLWYYNMFFAQELSLDK